MNSPEETRKTEKSETVAKGNKKSTETGNGLGGEKHYEFWAWDTEKFKSQTRYLFAKRKWLPLKMCSTAT